MVNKNGIVLGVTQSWGCGYRGGKIIPCHGSKAWLVNPKVWKNIHIYWFTHLFMYNSDIYILHIIYCILHTIYDYDIYSLLYITYYIWLWYILSIIYYILHIIYDFDISMTSMITASISTCPICRFRHAAMTSNTCVANGRRVLEKTLG